MDQYLGGKSRKSRVASSVAESLSQAGDSPHFLRSEMNSILYLVLALAPQSSPSELVSPAAGSGLAEQVLAIQEAKCLGCHGPDSDKPKALRKYKSPLDLAATVEEFVTPGDPEDSDLYFLLLDGDMPPDDSDVDPLTEAQVEIYRQWILAGAPLPEVSSTQVDPGGSAEPGGMVEPVPPAVPQSWQQRALALLGRQHPAVVHFPIGLLLSGALLEILIRFRRREAWLHAQRFCLRFGFLTALAAVGLGWLLAQDHRLSDDLQLHRWLGVSATVLAFLTALIIPKHAESPRRSFRFLLMSMATALVLTGHFGGYMVFGADYFRF
jgi:uncharacterized membrane protein